jgi:MFS transporter, FSR family, fosmidomycin resistance protein
MGVGVVRPFRWSRFSGAAVFAAMLLAVEFLDELVFGTREAAWPLIRADLDLSYAQIGLLLAIPELVSGVLEPLLGLSADTRWRRHIVLAGGVAFAVGVALVGASSDFAVLMLAMCVLYPASGAFVSLSQAVMVDAKPGDEEQSMARWTFAGSVGVVAGPLALTAFAFAGMSWRWLFLGFAAVTVMLVAGLKRWPADSFRATAHPHGSSIREALEGVTRAARRRSTWRWLWLLAMADLLSDVLLGFLALYLVDSAGVSPARAGLAVGVWAVVGLAGDGLVILALRRVSGLAMVRLTACAMVPAYVLFLLLPGFEAKVAALGLVALLGCGWYAVLQGQLYASLPGQSGAVISISSAFGIAEAAIPISFGLLAQRFGIGAAMLLLVLGPIALALGTPRGREKPNNDGIPIAIAE